MMPFFFKIIQKYFFSYSMFESYQRFKNRIRSWWLAPLFKECSKGVLFGKIGWLKGCKHICIDEETTFGDGLYLTAWNQYLSQSYTPKITIGKHCSFGAWCHITCIEKILIGNNVLIGKWVTISDNNHGNTEISDMQQEPIKRALTSKGPVIIEDNVWIGDKVSILSGVTIGEGSIIAANSVVTHNVPPYSVVGGNPARNLKRNKL